MSELDQSLHLFFYFLVDVLIKERLLHAPSVYYLRDAFQLGLALLPALQDFLDLLQLVTLGVFLVALLLEVDGAEGAVEGLLAGSVDEGVLGGVVGVEAFTIPSGYWIIVG